MPKVALFPKFQGRYAMGDWKGLMRREDRPAVEWVVEQGNLAESKLFIPYTPQDQRVIWFLPRNHIIYYKLFLNK